MPPLGHGWHHYEFVLFALDEPVKLPPPGGASRDELMTAIRPHIIAQGKLVGIYRRN